MIGLNVTFTEYWPFFTINFVLSLSIAAAAIEGSSPLPKLIASAVILYSPSFNALTSCGTVAGSSALWAGVVLVAAAGAVTEVAGAVVAVGGVAGATAAGVVAVGGVVGATAAGVVAVGGVAGATAAGVSAAKAKLSWSYASIAAIAENIAVADKTFNNVVFFILSKVLL